MRFVPGDEVYCRARDSRYEEIMYPGRWRVDTVSEVGRPVLCTNESGHQHRLGWVSLADFELCVIADFDSLMANTWLQVYLERAGFKTVTVEDQLPTRA